MSKRILKAALIQHAYQGSTETTLAYIEQQIGIAATQGAELILLQELHNTPYFCQVEDCQYFDLAETIPGPSSDFFSRIAAQHQVVIVSSLFEKRAPGLYHNTAVVLDKDGSIAGRYRKMHIPDDPGFYEKFYFTPGDLGFQPIETSIGKLGVLVCWDQWYPEAARLMALAGAEILLYPTAIGWDSRDETAEQQRQQQSWQLIQRSHAIANGLPVLSCNRTGHEADPSGQTPGSQFWGFSFACGAQGEILAQASSDQNEILMVDLDLQRTEDTRRIWPFFRDRRIDFFADLTQRYRD